MKINSNKVDVAALTELLKPHFEMTMARRGSNLSFDRFEMASVECDGNTLHLDILEAGKDKPTFVFVPGTAVYGLTFADFLAAIADQGINVVSFDPRGHGRSSGRQGNYTIMELVRDARAVIDYAKQRFESPVFISGSSQGGLVAFYTAATKENLAGAICHNLADLADPENAETTAHPTFTKLAKPLLNSLAKVFPNFSFSIQRYFSLLARGEHDVKDRMAADPLSLKMISFRALASLASTPLPKPVEEITTPIMILHGSADTIFKQPMIEKLYDRLNCEKSLKIYTDRDHFLFTEKIEQVVPDIVEWVNQRCK